MSVVLVTGSDRGIGNALCRAYRERGDTVIAACLGDSEELRALGSRVEPGVDVTSDEAVQGLARRLADTGTVLDLLINNAGIASGTRSARSISTRSGGNSRSTRWVRSA